MKPSKHHMEQPIYKTFSQLVEKYRADRKKSITDVYKFIKKCKYGLTYDAIRKYDRGYRPPDPYYLHFLKVCLELEEDQFQTLLKAVSIDHSVVLFKQAEEAEKNLLARNLPCFPRSSVE